MAEDAVDSESTDTAPDDAGDSTGDEIEASDPTDETAPDPSATDDEPTDDDEATPNDKGEKDAKDAKAGDKPAAPVVRKKVVSKRVTPKGGPAAKDGASGPTKPRTKVTAKEDDHSYSKRYTPPAAQYKAGPSPWWVPALMFGLIIIGALVIMLNYMQVFGDPKNIRLVIGLGFILGGIVTATQYR